MSSRIFLKRALSFVVLAAALASGAAADEGEWSEELPFQVEVVTRFEEPWALAFLPDGRLLVTEKQGKLLLMDVDSGRREEISGIPEVVHGGQGGLGDIALHPGFEDNGLVYFSYAEASDEHRGRQGAAVARARLNLESSGSARLEQREVIWRQYPKVSGKGHYGHRLLFGPDGMLWVSSSERQKFDPAQDLASNLGKILRLKDDGSAPEDNPFADQGPLPAQIWTLGHRNVLGMAFDAEGRLWAHEMGPRGGDELNFIQRGENYGYPIASEGRHYSGKPFPATHAEHPEFAAPVLVWTPVISPSDLIIYHGEAFPDWQGQALISGLSSKSLVQVELQSERSAREVARHDMGQRIRAVAEDERGQLWLLEDGGDQGPGRLLRLTPKPQRAND